MQTVGSPAMWGGFIAAILFMLAIDLGFVRRRGADDEVMSTRQALMWVILWVSLALAFGFGVVPRLAPEGMERQLALEFLTGYVIEYALSVDNIFVFLVIFSYFSVPAEYQRRVLVWGVLGAIVMRAIFILLGAALITRFHWIIYVFGVFLIFTGFKILTQKDDEVHPEDNPLIKLFRRAVRMVPRYHGKYFLVRENGVLYATPLLLVLVTVEVTDLIFAVDSIPAIFAITKDPFIVFTSNIFAILGLRALFFLLSGAMDKFHYLKVGLGLVLSFVGLKMVISEWYKIPIGVSLGVIVTLLGGSMVASLLNPPTHAPLPDPPDTTDPDLPPLPADPEDDVHETHGSATWKSPK